MCSAGVAAAPDTGALTAGVVVQIWQPRCRCALLRALPGEPHTHNLVRQGHKYCWAAPNKWARVSYTLLAHSQGRILRGVTVLAQCSEAPHGLQHMVLTDLMCPSSPPPPSPGSPLSVALRLPPLVSVLSATRPS
jgi:hypothetical protein